MPSCRSQARRALPARRCATHVLPSVELRSGRAQPLVRRAPSDPTTRRLALRTSPESAETWRSSVRSATRTRPCRIHTAQARCIAEEIERAVAQLEGEGPGKGSGAGAAQVRPARERASIRPLLGHATDVPAEGAGSGEVPWHRQDRTLPAD